MATKQQIAEASQQAALLAQNLFYTCALAADSAYDARSAAGAWKRLNDGAEKLDSLMKTPGVADALSRGNPQMVDVAGIPSMSYASGVLSLATRLLHDCPLHILEAYDEETPLAEIFPAGLHEPGATYTLVGECEKEFERATPQLSGDLRKEDATGNRTAGRAFAAIVERDGLPESLQSMQERILEIGEVLGPAVRTTIDEQRERLRQAGFPTDGDWLKCLEHIARMADRDPDDLTAVEIENWAMAWIDRERLKLRLAEEMETVPGATGTKPLPILHSNAKGAAIEWRGTRHPVSHEWVAAFKKMLDAEGQPVGLGGGDPLRKTVDDLTLLESTAPELRALIVKGHGNSGYRLTIFD